MNRMSNTYFGRCAVAVAATAALAVGCAQPASAEPVVTGIVGQHTPSTCGWYNHDEGMLSLWYDKIVRVYLPQVTGVSAGQLVWAHVRFAQPDANGNFADYRTAWFYTYASPDQLTTTWTWYETGQTGITNMDDAPGESGYASGDTQNPVTAVFVTLFWVTGSSYSTVDEAAVNASNPQYPQVCNGGGSMF